MAEGKAKLEEEKKNIEGELTKLTEDITEIENALNEATLTPSQEELKKNDLNVLLATKKEKEDAAKDIEAQLAAMGESEAPPPEPTPPEAPKAEEVPKPEEKPQESKPKVNYVKPSTNEIMQHLREEKMRLESVKKGKQQSNKNKLVSEEKKIKETIQELGDLQRDGYLSKSDVNIDNLEKKMERKRNSLQKEAKHEEDEIRDIDVEIKRVEDLLKNAGNPESEAKLRDWDENQLAENRKRWKDMPGSRPTNDPIAAPVLVGDAPPLSDSSVLAELKTEEAKAAKINKEIAALKEELAQYAKKDKMSEEDIKGMRQKQDLLMEKMKEFAEITKNVQNLMGLAKVTSSQLGPPRKQMIPMTQEKAGPAGAYQPQDTLPKVIVCGSGGEDQVPKIIICEPTTNANDGKRPLYQQVRSKSQEECMKAREQAMKKQNCQQSSQGMPPNASPCMGLVPSPCRDFARNSPTAFGPQMMSQGMMPPGMMPQGMMPHGMMPPGMMPPGMMQQGMMPPGMMPPGMMGPSTTPPFQPQMSHPPPTLPSKRVRHAKLILTGNGPVLVCFPAEKKSRKKEKIIDPPCPHYFPCVRDLCDSDQKSKQPNPTKTMALKALCQLHCGESKNEKSSKKQKECFCHAYAVKEPCK